MGRSFTVPAILLAVAAVLLFLLLGNISSSRKDRLKPIFSSGHANPVLNEKVCACPLDQKAQRTAFEIAVRTGTALVYSRDGKIIEEKPPYRYELVPIKKGKKKRIK